MYPTLISQSNDLTLDKVIARLSEHDIVDAILLVGSTGKGTVNPESDYDITVVLSEMPVPMRLALTFIDHRLADVIFLTVQTIDDWLEIDEPVPAYDSSGVFFSWLREGSIAFDRSGRLERLRQKTQTGQWLQITEPGKAYELWRHINYNLKQNRRMLASNDPVYLMAVDFRLLYSLVELWDGYQQLRGILWRGEKEAIRYFQAHDPEYLDLFNQCLAESDRQRKFALYEQLVALTLAPTGGIVDDAATTVALDSGSTWQPEMVEQALAFWESLIAKS